MIATLIERRAAALAFALVTLATVRIVATYPVFSHTNDEPAHVACGMEWLDRGAYGFEAEHPPLARVAVALGPYLLGRRSAGTTGPNAMHFEGLAILYRGTTSDNSLAAARAGVLPFFWLAAFVVYVWARRDLGPAGAVLATFFFTMLPPVLAHAGLATTDMALTATLGAAFYSGRLWLERPTLRSGAIFGLCGALAVMSKFSSLAFFAAATVFAMAYCAAGRELRFDNLRRYLPSLALALAAGCALVWAVYRFSFAPIDPGGPEVPAPEFFRGIREVIQHNRHGHPSYLLGQISPTGFRSFYFVVLAVKTPIAILILAAIGLALRPARLAAAYAAAIVAVGIFSHINIGVRHILPVYTGLSILAAGGVVWLAANATGFRWTAVATAVLLTWCAGSSLLSHPDYLPYFNEFAGGHPEKILVDSDLDWGQDMKRLMKRLEPEHTPVVTMAMIYPVYQRRGEPAIRKADPFIPSPGWNAVSVSAWKQLRFGLPDDPSRPFWPDRIPPQEIVGKSIYLWRFAP